MLFSFIAKRDKITVQYFRHIAFSRFYEVRIHLKNTFSRTKNQKQNIFWQFFIPYCSPYLALQLDIKISLAVITFSGTTNEDVRSDLYVPKFL